MASDLDPKLSPLNYLELNNRLIDEAYSVSKRREYVQHHIGEVEMDILDTEENQENNPFLGYSKAMELLRNKGKG